MKKQLYLLLAGFTAIGSGLLSSCDHVTNPYPQTVSTDLDQSLYPGDWATYVSTEWPVFTPNTNTTRNVMIEDYTGHTCFNCPAAADLAKNIAAANPGRVFVATIHTGPTGMGVFQVVQQPDYPTDWTNPQGLEIGNFFGTIPGSAFQGNPRGTVNRVPWNDQLTLHPSSWTSRTNTTLATPLRVNIQSKANYYASTRGLFLHTEVDVVDASLTNPLGMVVYFIEDSIVGDQKMADNSHNANYVHHDVMRGCIDGQAFGRAITADYLDPNGNYYLNYSYHVPAQYNIENTHLLIYVFDKTTYEIYQVIEQHIQD